MVLCGHRHSSQPQALQGGVLIEKRVVLGIHVDKVEGPGFLDEVPFNVAKKPAKQSVFKWMKEMREGWLCR